MVTKARKIFCVVAYDIANDKRRTKIVKVLEKVGLRINYSVFECMLTRAQLAVLQEEIRSLINAKFDTVVYYPICVRCFTRIVYQPGQRYEKAGGKVVVVS